MANVSHFFCFYLDKSPFLCYTVLLPLNATLSQPTVPGGHMTDQNPLYRFLAIIGVSVLISLIFTALAAYWRPDQLAISWLLAQYRNANWAFVIGFGVFLVGVGQFVQRFVIKTQRADMLYDTIGHVCFKLGALAAIYGWMAMKHLRS